MNIRRILTVAVASSALVLAGCATGTSDDENTAQSSDAMVVKASFYPLQYLVEQIGGEKVSVDSLTPPGADAHSLELSPKAVADLGAADAVVYLRGFQTAVDQAIDEAAPAHVLDVAAVADLVDTGASHNHDDEHGSQDHDDEADTHEGEEHAHEAEGHSHDAEEHAHEADEHDHEDNTEAMDEHGDDDDHAHDHSALSGDPHFWLDPSRMNEVATEVATFLSTADPDNAAFYMDNLQGVSTSLNELDDQIEQAFTTCALDTFVVSHEAFGYLAQKAGLHQVGVSGLEPEVAPSPSRLQEISKVVEENGVDVIFAEANVSPKAIEVLAEDLGVETMVLDPGATQNDPNLDYMQIMKQNLDNLKKGLKCQ